jgi:hypothetical protein
MTPSLIPACQTSPPNVPALMRSALHRDLLRNVNDKAGGHQLWSDVPLITAVPIRWTFFSMAACMAPIEVTLPGLSLVTAFPSI